MLLAQGLDSDVSVDLQYEEGVRFSFSLEKEYLGQLVRLVVRGSEARVVCCLDLSSIPSAVIKGRIMSLLVYGEITSLGYITPYRFTLWQGAKDFRALPKMEVLLNREGLVLELSSPPCDISDPNTGAVHSIDIARSFMGFLQDVVFCEHSLNSVDGDIEGGECELVATRYERSTLNRKMCIAHFGCKCQVCGLDLIEVYGVVAEGFIHVHHIEKLADGGEKVIDPIKDLIPVCPNCHGIMHRSDPPLKPEELKMVLIARNGVV